VTAVFGSGAQHIATASEEPRFFDDSLLDDQND
jgi:hypothetical protein